MSNITLMPDYPYNATSLIQSQYESEWYYMVYTAGLVTVTINLVLWMTFLVRTRIKRIKWGRAHIFLTIWLPLLIPGPLLYKYL